MAAHIDPTQKPEENALEQQLPRRPGQNLLGITYIAEDFDALLPEDVLQDFGL